MFELFKKKKPVEIEETDPNKPSYPAPPGDPLTLPVIPPELQTVENLRAHLQDGETIWAWIPEKETKKGLLGAFTNMFVSSFKGYYVYELKQKYLYKYQVIFEVMQGYEQIIPYLKEQAVWKMDDSVIEEWLSGDFAGARAVHYDDRDTIKKAQRLQLKLTEDDIKKYLHTHDRLDITDDDFRKRGDE